MRPQNGSMLSTLVLLLFVLGCGDAPEPDGTDSELVSAPAAQANPVSAVDDAANESPTDVARPAREATASPASATADLSYISDDFIGALMVHPQRMISSPFGTNLINAGIGTDHFDDYIADLSAKAGIDLTSVDELTWLIDRSWLEATGIAKPAKRDTGDRQRLEQLKQVGLAFHNYHEVHRAFPRHDGPGQPRTPENTGLSWRVHLLPFLDHTDLYKQFKLTEPWDSDHNQALIDQMPDVFRSHGVDAKGKTSIHVFVGKDAPFHDDPRPTRIRDFTDGTSNTILAVEAAPDRADVWTKPGGLSLDLDNPLASLGTLDSDGFIGLNADGAVYRHAADTDSTDLSRMIRHQDSEVIENPPWRRRSRGPRPSQSMPAFVARFNEDVDTASVVATLSEKLGPAQQKSAGRHTYQLLDGYAVAFPDQRTVVAGAEQTLLRMLDSKPGQSEVRTRLKTHAGSSDVLLVAELDSERELLQTTTAMLPILGPLNELSAATILLNIAGSPGDSLMRWELTAIDDSAASDLKTIMAGQLVMQRKQLEAMSRGPLFSDSLPEPGQLLGRVMAAATLEQQAATVVYDIPVPDDYATVIAALKPQFEILGTSVRQAREVAQRMQFKNNLKQVGLAFHNYHDAFGTLPRATGPGGRTQEPKPGLSWRVHLLPFLDQVELYKQFKLDEPWDSAHNKLLVNRMPDVFKVKGVDEAGMTSIHVFTGPGTPFGDGTVALSFSRMTDGTSNTFLAVLAGPDSADVWTKPGGIEFDPANPHSALGSVAEAFLALMADGAVRFVSSKITTETLSRLIQHADGENVGDFTFSQPAHTKRQSPP